MVVKILAGSFIFIFIYKEEKFVVDKSHFVSYWEVLENLIQEKEINRKRFWRI